MAKKGRTASAVNREVAKRDPQSGTNRATATAAPASTKSAGGVSDRRHERARGRRAAVEAQRKRRRMQRIAIGAGAVVIVLLVGAFLYQRSTEDDVPADRITTGVPTATDPGLFVAPLNSSHVAQGNNVSNYNSDPPTSGDHWPNTGPWGISNNELDDELLVHNLEHGGIIVEYNCPEGCQDIVDQLTAIVSPYPVKLILAPRDNMEHTIAVTAWTRLLTMDAVDAAQIQAFIDAYIDKGPEKIQSETEALEAAGF
jgi:hypothetical protein